MPSQRNAMQPNPSLPELADSGSGALDRGLAILDHLAEARSSSTAALGEALGLTRSTTYRLVGRLRQQGWLVADAATGEWRLGPSAARLASAAVESTSLKDSAIPALRELLNLTQETVNLTVPIGLEMVFIHRERSPRSAAVSAELGTSRPLHCTSAGRAYLAGLPDDRLDRTLIELIQSPNSPVSISNVATLRDEVEKTRERGWSHDLREFDESTCCCGAPIFDHTGLPIAAISVSGIAERMERVIDQVGPLVMQTALEVSRSLGYIGGGLKNPARLIG
jgi:DNA-binding IclR family transcriptional regulator